MDGLQFLVLTDPAQLEQAYRLRYDTYVREWGDFPTNESETESDDYDAAATHIGAILNGELVGYVRLISQKPLPVFTHCNLYPAFQDLPNADLKETSRLVVRAGHRRGEVSVGLFKAIYDLGLRRSVAAMEPKLAYRIGWAGYTVQRIGTPSDHYGGRSPYLLSAT